MDGYPARSVDTLKQRTPELAAQISGTKTEIQAAGIAEQGPLPMNGPQKAPRGTDDLKRPIEDDVRSPVAPFFLF
jgi:hypothetical protein